jgi:peptide chain release factor 1
MLDWLDRLSGLDEKFRALDAALSDPKVYDDRAQVERLGRVRAELEPIIGPAARYRKVGADLQSVREMLNGETDAEIVELAQEELTALERESDELEDQLRLLLLPKDPNDDKNTIVEI